MSTETVVITGLGSVSCAGCYKGFLDNSKARIRPITSWEFPNPRLAYVVEPFEAHQIVPGLRTRRLDRLSVWTLVASALAAQDAAIDDFDLSPDDKAFVFGTGLGCMQLSEEYMLRAFEDGFTYPNPIIFPDTLDNIPAGHFAEQFNYRGPNITISSRGISGESALVQSAELIKRGEAELVISASGDILTRPLYEWCEAGALLSRSCFQTNSSTPSRPFAIGTDGIVPGEGVCAVVMESLSSARSRGARIYAEYIHGETKGDPKVGAASYGDDRSSLASLIRKVMAHIDKVDLVISCANGLEKLDRFEAAAILEAFDESEMILIVTPKANYGEFDGSGILRLAAAISGIGSPCGYHNLFGSSQVLHLRNHGNYRLENKTALLLGCSAGGSQAALLFKINLVDTV